MNTNTFWHSLSSSFFGFFNFFFHWLTHYILEKLVPARSCSWWRCWTLSLLGVLSFTIVLLLDFVAWILRPACDSGVDWGRRFLGRAALLCGSLLTLAPIAKFNRLSKFAVVVTTIPMKSNPKKINTITHKII